MKSWYGTLEKKSLCNFHLTTTGKDPAICLWQVWVTVCHKNKGNDIECLV